MKNKLLLSLAIILVIGMLLSACSSSTTIDSPQGKLQIESLDYSYDYIPISGAKTSYIVLTLIRADKDMFSVGDLNYIIQSGAYLEDSQGNIYKIPDNVKEANFLDVTNIDIFQLKFVGYPGKDRNFVLHWPGNDPTKIIRETHRLIDD